MAPEEPNGAQARKLFAKMDAMQVDLRETKIGLSNVRQTVDGYGERLGDIHKDVRDAAVRAAEAKVIANRLEKVVDDLHHSVPKLTVAFDRVTDDLIPRMRKHSDEIEALRAKDDTRAAFEEGENTARHHIITKKDRIWMRIGQVLAALVALGTTSGGAWLLVKAVQNIANGGK